MILARLLALEVVEALVEPVEIAARLLGQDQVVVSEDVVVVLAQTAASRRLDLLQSHRVQAYEECATYPQSQV